MEIDEIASRLVEGYLVVDRPLAECAASLDGWSLGERSTFKVDGVSDLAQTMEHLSRLTFPPTRHVAFPVLGQTVFVNNGRNGSDFADYSGQFAELFQAKVASVVNRPGRVWRRGRLKEVVEYEARSVDVLNATGERERRIDCINDGGRWVFQVDGKQHPIEETFNYSARRKKDRFTSDNLASLLRSFGFPSIDESVFLGAESHVLVTESLCRRTWAREVSERSCTWRQRDDPAFGYYQRGLGFADHMATHAESVIHDLEKALEINPEFETHVRPLLDEAYRIRSGRR